MPYHQIQSDWLILDCVNFSRIRNAKVVGSTPREKRFTQAKYMFAYVAADTFIQLSCLK